MDEHSGGDHVRGRASEISLGETHDDRVSAAEGDHSDWKRFAILQPTQVTINVYWDNPSIRSKVFIKDQFGGVMFALPHDSSNRHDRWPNIRLREGEYYLHVVAQKGTSVYTLEITHEGGLPSPGSSGGSVTRPESPKN
jgi:hypothetical protein